MFRKYILKNEFVLFNRSIGNVSHLISHLIGLICPMSYAFLCDIVCPFEYFLLFVGWLEKCTYANIVREREKRREI